MPSSLKTRRIKEKVHQIQESLHIKSQKEGMIEHHLTLNTTVVTRRVIILEIALRRKMVHTTTLEATIAGFMIEEEMIKRMITME